MNSLIVTPSNQQEYILLSELLKKMKIMYKTLSNEEEIVQNNDDELWQQYALNNLSKAYSDDEPEYTSDMIKESNPDYNSSFKGEK